MTDLASAPVLSPSPAGDAAPGSGPLVLDGDGLLFLVEAGALELRLSLPGQAGTAVPLLTVPAGGLVAALGTAEYPVRAWPEPKNSNASSTDISSTSLMLRPPSVYSSTAAWNRLPSHSSHTVATPAIIARSV